MSNKVLSIFTKVLEDQVQNQKDLPQIKFPKNVYDQKIDEIFISITNLSFLE